MMRVTPLKFMLELTDDGRSVLVQRDILLDGGEQARTAGRFSREFIPGRPAHRAASGHKTCENAD
jgi:hypothetical protein